MLIVKNAKHELIHYVKQVMVFKKSK